MDQEARVDSRWAQSRWDEIAPHFNSPAKTSLTDSKMKVCANLEEIPSDSIIQDRCRSNRHHLAKTKYLKRGSTEAAQTDCDQKQFTKSLLSFTSSFSLKQ